MIKRHSNTMIATFIAVGFFAPVLWMALDRVPPYERLSGTIKPDYPTPGSNIEIEWEIKTLRACIPSARLSVRRQIVDAKGTVWNFDPTTSVYYDETTRGRQINRSISLPRGVATGPATYRSMACFSCNPIHALWPVCVDKPEITFTIGSINDQRP